VGRMEPAELLYEGKSKAVFATSDPNRVIVRFKDDATAFNGVKHAEIDGKGRINCGISAHLFDRCAQAGIRHHMVERLTDTDMLCERVEIIPVEVIVRNVVAGSFAKRYGLNEGAALPGPLIEWFYKSDALNDPLMGRDVPIVLGWAKSWELAFMEESARAVNAVLLDFWNTVDVQLIDMKLEYGRTPDGRILLADELTPDGSRLWEKGTQKRFDKDVFRRDLGDLGETYAALYARIFG
jgi:phosphoribosylaminoimidazole-succinocarboxamide synthase